MVVSRTGVDSVSLRELAERVGVTHTAIRHHFGSRDGVLTALAAEGYHLLADCLAEVRENGGSFLDTGVAYVAFAQERPAHYSVMFDMDVLLPKDDALLEAQERAWRELRYGIDSLPEQAPKQDMAIATIAGWAMMHGLVRLDGTQALAKAHLSHLAGDLPLTELAARIGSMLSGSTGGTA